MRAKPITWHNVRSHWTVFLLPIPTLALVALFSYIPAAGAITHSFFRWDGAFIEEFVGFLNFRRLLGVPSLWTPVLLAVLAAYCALLTTGSRVQRVWLILAAIATAVSLVVLGLDAWKSGEPSALGGVWWFGLPLLASGIATRAGSATARSWGVGGIYATLLVACIFYLTAVRGYGDALFWMSFQLIFILIIANLFKMWPSIFTAVCIHRLKSDRAQYLYRVLFVIPMIIPTMVMLLVWKFFYDPNVGPLNELLRAMHLDTLLSWLDSAVFRTGAFSDPFRPAWLAEPSLIVPALIFWGFPWVGVVGVLIYLAGLQNISGEIYEAAELDGISWWGKFVYLELPLIMTQIRLNLILMIIGTFQAFGLQLILLGPEGGPGNKGLTPGLYMFYVGFSQQEYGYACAIGLSLFVIILMLTIINHRFIRVQK